MTRVSLQLPSSIHQRAKNFAKRDGVSLDQLVALALAEKLSAFDAQEYLQQRAARGSREKFERAKPANLSKVMSSLENSVPAKPKRYIPAEWTRRDVASKVISRLK